MKSMFDSCSNLANLVLTTFDTSSVTTMKNMFFGCSSLTNLDLSSFTTANVTDMTQMFANCASLTSLDLTTFNSSNVTKLFATFYGCTALENIYFSDEFSTEKVTDMSGAFYKCTSLTSLDISGFNTGNVTTMQQMFYECSSLASLNLINFNTANVTNMNAMFYNCASLTSLDLTGFDVSNVNNTCVMFYGCVMLETIEFSVFNAKNVEDMSGMFYNCSSLTSLDLSGFNTESVTNMLAMFSGCSSLTSLNLSSFNTSKVTTMQNMFLDCSALTSLDLNSFDTQNVTTMSQMFAGCSSLTSLNVTSFNTKNVTDMTAMFYNCSLLTSLNVSSFDTSSVTTMGYMFDTCTNLTSLDLSNFNTSKVTTMFQMFARCPYLKSINVSSFDTSNVTTMQSMFFNNDALTSLDLSSFDLKSVTDITAMFAYTYNIKTFKTPYCSNSSKTISFALPPLYASSWYYKNNVALGAVSTHDCTTTSAELVVGYTISYKDKGGSTFTGKFSGEYPTLRLYGENITLANPTKAGNRFVGWYLKSDCTGEAVTTLTDANCITNTTLYASWIGRYTITWANYDGSVIYTETLDAGVMPEYSGETPVKPATAEFTYTFSGWTPEIVAASKDATYKATFTETRNKYLITWLNHDDSELDSEQVEYGQTPVYSGSTPVKEADAKYTYTFSGWTPEVTKVTGDATYKATFSKSVNKYLITWVNYDDSKLYEEEVEYDALPTYKGETPQKTGDAQYTYTFKSWTPEVTKVTGNATYKATFTEIVNVYTITWLNHDDSELYSEQLEYGQKPAYDGEIPTKPADAKYTYTFSGWTPEIAVVTGDATYKATFTETINKYIIMWLNYDGTELHSSKVEYGRIPTYTGETPQRPSDAQFSYTFSGWDPEPTEVTKDATYKAVYSTTTNKYTITWLNFDGTKLYEEDVEYGAVPEYTGETPEKPSDVQYTYTFSGWTPELVEVTGNASYTAKFSKTLNKYTITWLNYDGTELYSAKVEYGTTPTYTGETPVKESDVQFTYTFSGWEPKLEAVTGDASYTATYSSTLNKYVITWLNYDETELLTTEVEYGSVPTYTGETPERPRDVKYTYTFSGWEPKLEAVTGATTYKATYTETINKYTITWLNYDGTKLLTTEVEYGSMPTYTGETPEKEGDDQYTYVFTGWEPKLVAVTGDATYTAIFADSANVYTITWLNYDGTELLTTEVEYGNMPTYTGKTPVREKDAQYTYTFSGWTPELVEVTGNASYTATFTSTKNKYTITWLNYDGTEIYNAQVEYGQMPTYTSETPVKEGNAQYSYTFSGWNPKVVEVTGDATYTAVFIQETNKYDVTWVNYDGTTIYTEKVEYGITPTYSGETPVKPGNAQYSYVFLGWEPIVAVVTCDAIYTAMFTEEVNKYTITWKNYDGEVLLVEEVAYGTVPVYTGETPVKEGSDQFSYVFTGWDPVPVAVTCDASYTATFADSTNVYTITWLNHDGSELLETEVEYGEIPVYTGETPVKEGNEQYSYEFSGWMPELAPATSDATYTATFNEILNKYFVIWANYDGTELLKQELIYGTMPEYTGETPVRERDAEFTYTFSGWTPEIVVVTGNAKYTAKYTAVVNKYVVIWLNHDGTELYREELEYGAVPEYKGKTPTKEGNAQYSYEFSGWVPEIAEVTGDITYTAQFTEIVNKYTITWENYDGSLIYSENIEYGQMPEYTGETPVKPANAEFTYTFIGWTPQIVEVTSDATYTATFDYIVNKYTIIWINWDDSELYRSDVDYGTMPEYLGETPVKENNEEFTYTFTGWTPEVTKVTGNATYKATFKEEVNKYVITWVNYNGAVLYSEEVAYGQLPIYAGTTPVKEGNAQYSYTFSGWTPEIVEVTEDATYTAVFTEEVNKYTIIWVNYDNTELLKQELEYGEMPEYTGETPVRFADEDNKYVFSIWTPEVDIVTKDVTYTAVFITIEIFDITWKNYDGTVLRVDKVERGTMPEYGEVSPTKPKDAQYTYTFIGWTPEVVLATSDAIYVATFEATLNTYNISLKYVKGDEVLGMVNYTVNFADVFTLNIARDNLNVLSVMVNDEEIEIEDNRIVISSVTEDLEIVVYYTEKVTGFIVPIAIIAGSAMLIFVLIFIIKKIKEKADDNADTSEAYRKLVQANGLNVGNVPTPEQPTSVNVPKPEIIDTINRQVGVSGQVKQGPINKPIAKPSVNAPQKPSSGATIKKAPAKPAESMTKPTMSKPVNINAGTKLPPKPVAPKAPPKPVAPKAPPKPPAKPQ